MKTSAFLMLVLVVTRTATPQSVAPSAVQEISATDFCDLFRHPDHYTGQTVRTSATYVTDLEGGSFFDEACKKSESLPEATANAKFTRSTRGRNKLDKALGNNKLVPDLLKVTIVAVFVDEHAGDRVTACTHCSRYSLEVKEVIAAAKVRPASNPG
jgi:hypothetical protein